MIFIADRVIDKMFAGDWECTIRRWVLGLFEAKEILMGDPETAIKICPGMDELVVDAIARRYGIEFSLYDTADDGDSLNKGDSLLVVDVDCLRNAIRQISNQQPVDDSYAFIQYERLP